MKIVVTGALGHIGSRLIRGLGASFPFSEIIMIDNLMTQRYASLFNLPETCKYRFIEADINDLDLSIVLKGADVVIHLAAITDAAGSFGRAEQLEQNNFNATKLLAEACIVGGVRLVMISSTSVYGTQSMVVDEYCSESELQPQSPYATTKLKEERLVQQLSLDRGLKVVVLRFGTICGQSPGMRFHTAINKFCWQAVMGKPITVWSTAYDQKRPYLDLLDAINAISFVIKNIPFDGEIYNVLTDNLTVRNVVEFVKKYIPNVDINFVDNQIMNQLSYEVSCEKIKNKGFIFSGNIKSAIGETVALLRNAN
jgi:nucleoside-diphosphate-sugar epimerase